jgi:CheY-like chemotaxis protein
MVTVLVVEDDQEILELEADLLSRHGYRVEKASNGRAALQALEKVDGPCILLLNVVMPEMAGPRLLEHLRANGRMTTCNVIVLTASAMTASELGVRRLIRKPVSAAALLAVVAEAVADQHRQ